MKLKSKVVVAATAFLSACASQPNEIPAQSVSTLIYKDYDCDQLAMEADRVNRRVGELYTSLKKTADGDAMQMGVGLVLFWPALFFLEGGDGPEAQEYARLKGERQAIETVAIRRKCDIRFQPIEPQSDAVAESSSKKTWSPEESE